MSSCAALSPPQILFYIVGANPCNIIDLIVHSIIYTKQTERIVCPFFWGGRGEANSLLSFLTTQQSLEYPFKNQYHLAVPRCMSDASM